MLRKQFKVNISSNTAELLKMSHRANINKDMTKAEA